MKTNSMVKSMTKIIALLMAIVMCFAACGSETDVSSNQDASVNSSANQEVESKTEESPDTSEAESAVDGSDKEETTSNTQSNNTQNNNTQNSNIQNNNTQNNKDNNSDNNNQNNNNQPTQNNNQTVTNTKTTWDDNYLATMPDSVKKKGVTVLMWRNFLPTEKKLIEDFEKKTGCKVTVIKTTEPQYSTKLISLIAGKQSPDVVQLAIDDFPGRAVKAMVPLDKAMFRLDDDCWDKASMENVKINNNYYGVAMPKTWSCSDTHYVTFYQPNVLKACGVSTMPYELWKQGKWNWDTQQQTAQKIAAANRGYSAISMQTTDIMMLAAGTDFVSYDGKQYTNTLKNAKSNGALVKSWQATVRLKEAGYITGWDLQSVKTGKTGLFTTIAYGLYNEADWKFKDLPGGAESVNAVPVAAETQSGAYVPYRPKTWGTVKGAKNPEGAAYFLRYYLDSENCDFDSTFLNSQCKEVFNYIVAKTTKRKARLGAGAIDFVSSNNYSSMISKIATTTSASITTAINSNVGTVDAALRRVNKEIEKAK